MSVDKEKEKEKEKEAAKGAAIGEKVVETEIVEEEAPMTIIASAIDQGLGLLTWWRPEEDIDPALLIVFKANT